MLDDRWWCQSYCCAMCVKRWMAWWCTGSPIQRWSTCWNSCVEHTAVIFTSSNTIGSLQLRLSNLTMMWAHYSEICGYNKYNNSNNNKKKKKKNSPIYMVPFAEEHQRRLAQSQLCGIKRVVKKETSYLKLSLCRISERRWYQGQNNSRHSMHFISCSLLAFL